eukprot:10094-Eustigmatos_ZCMA.PRE.1
MPSRASSMCGSLKPSNMGTIHDSSGLPPSRPQTPRAHSSMAIRHSFSTSCVRSESATPPARSSGL